MAGLLLIVPHTVFVANLSVEHALSCPNGAFPSIRHNDVWDMTAALLSEVCLNVSNEPSLQPLSGESLSLASANPDSSARLDRYLASGVAGISFFDVRMFNPLAPSNQSNPYRQHEAAKRRQYEECVREIEHGSFSPLIFSASGGMSASTAFVYKHLASTKWKTPYSEVIHWLCCCLCFSLLHSAVMCIRGSCSSFQRPCTTFC